MLEVSDKSISADKIDQSTSHLPFDVEKFLEAILIKDQHNETVPLIPIRPQTSLINGYLSSKYRFITAILARRTGKTLIANALGLLTILQPEHQVLVIAPNYNLSLISYELQRKFIKNFGIDIVKDNIKDRHLQISNGSSIRMGSINQVDSVIGRSYDLIIMDEAAISNKGEDAFNQQLRPTLDRANSKILFLTTPRGKNWVYDFYMRGFSDEYPQWLSIRSDCHENPRLLESDLVEAKKTLSKAAYDQEYMAEFNQLQGAIYHLETECIIFNLLDSLGPSHEYDVIIGADFGFRDPTAYVVLYVDIENHKAYLVDEYQENGKTTAEYAEALQKLITKHNPDVIFGDAANAQTMYDLAMDHDISCRKAKKSRLDGIGYIASFIDNNDLIIDGDCKLSIEAIKNYQWKESHNSGDEFTKEDPKHNMASHLNDALRYALYSYSQNMVI